MGTPFEKVYSRFLNRITDDMYLEMTESDTYQQLQGLLINAIPHFKLPRVDLFDYTLGELIEIPNENPELPSDFSWSGGEFNSTLTAEEENIISVLMSIEWFGQQIAVVENTRLKFTSGDYKMSSQANHMAKLKVMKDDCLSEAKRLIDIYKRHKKGDMTTSSLDQIMKM